MVRRIWPLLLAIICFAIFSCATNNNQADNGASVEADGVSNCRGNCVQPPIRQDEMIDHLQENQERILAREDYKNYLPDSVLEIIYGPIPSDHLRDGPAPVCDEGISYDGDLSWHYVPFEEVATEGASHASLRGRDVSGAHCYFAHRPNRLTPIFAVLANHRGSRGDDLYLGGPNHRVIRIDTSPLTRGMGGAIEVHTDHMHCAFRHDQNQMGTVIVPFDYLRGPNAGSGPHYAVFAVTTYGQKQPTGEFIVAERRSGLPGGHTIPLEVPVLKYPKPHVDFVAHSTSLRQALEDAEAAIHSGDFRLRPEFVYPTMPYQSYLDTGVEEFCPVNTDCQTPPAHINSDLFPRLPQIDLEEYQEGLPEDFRPDDTQEEADSEDDPDEVDS